MMCRQSHSLNLATAFQNSTASILARKFQYHTMMEYNFGGTLRTALTELIIWQRSCLNHAAVDFSCSKTSAIILILFNCYEWGRVKPQASWKLQSPTSIVLQITAGVLPVFTCVSWNYYIFQTAGSVCIISHVL